MIAWLLVNTWGPIDFDVEPHLRGWAGLQGGPEIQHLVEELGGVFLPGPASLVWSCVEFSVELSGQIENPPHLSMGGSDLLRATAAQWP